MLLFSDLAAPTTGKILQLYRDQPVSHLLYDSRKIIISHASIFFAIRSRRRDGHVFIKDLYNRGINQFVVDTEFQNISDFPNANFLLVENPVKAMQDIAAFHRSGFFMPVIGITGSNGKTIVKEWLFQLLSDKYLIVKSPKSFNSQIGVPLSVWQMNEMHQLAIFEAGISTVAEMQNLEAVIRPDIGILTNIGSAHDEGFKDRSEKLLEKIKLFKNSRVIICNSDQEGIVSYIQQYFPDKHILTWGEQGQIKIRKVVSLGSSALSVEYNSEKFSFNVPFSDVASIQNICHCVATMLYLGIPQDEIINRVKKLTPIGMRLELKQGINNTYLIDDAYNNDFAGLTLAVQFLGQQKHLDKKTAIISDLLESGITRDKLYNEIAEVLKSNKINRLIGIGQEISQSASFFEDFESSFYPDTAEFINSSAISEFSDEMILIKGARKFQFESIVDKLIEKVHGTVLEINLDALSHNLNYYRSLLKPSTKTMVMVKAFAYGSGIAEVAGLLQFHKVDYLAVAYADEGVALRNQGISLPVMVMNPTVQSFEHILRYNLEPEIYSLRVLKQFMEFMSRKNSICKIHIKLDTGMRRLGFEEKDLNEMLNIISNSEKLRVESVFTHLAAADCGDFNEFTLAQLRLYEKLSSRIEKSLGYSVIKHALNSAGIVRFPDYQMDMVRLGIGLYGFEANGLEQSKLLPVSTLKTVISQIKELDPGVTVGYSRKWKTLVKSRIATIAIGYADGFDRKFSNGVGKVLIDGQLCPIVGNVCMDMCMVDVTGTNAQEGDPVVIFGDTPSISDLADKIGTIPYEILTGVSERVKRVFYSE